MARLFGRKWSVQIDRTTFNDFDMSFQIVRTTKPEPNTCELHLYNLSADERGALEGTSLLAPPASPGGAAGAAAALLGKGIPVKIEAGYEEADATIWLGDLRTIESHHEGPDWITVLGSGDGEKAFQQSRINLSFGKGTPIATVVTALVKAMGLGPGNMPLYLARLAVSPTASLITSQGLVLSGSASSLLTNIAQSVGLEWSIQDGVVQFTERGLPTLGQVVLVSPSSGMVGEPTIDNKGIVTVKMLMIPNVVPGAVIVVNSERIKGNFRIETATYEGDTSGQPWYITAVGKPF